MYALLAGRVVADGWCSIFRHGLIGIDTVPDVDLLISRTSGKSAKSYTGYNMLV